MFPQNVGFTNIDKQNEMECMYTTFCGPYLHLIYMAQGQKIGYLSLNVAVE